MANFDLLFDEDKTSALLSTICLLRSSLSVICIHSDDDDEDNTDCYCSSFYSILLALI